MNDMAAMIQFLQQYISIETVHPSAEYMKAVAFLEKRAREDGFLTQIVPLSSGLPALIITYKGTNNSLPSVVLNHHMDVVPAPYTQEWITHPFRGEIRDGMVIGRGTQDMKGVGAIHYYALKALKDAGMRPARTIHIVAVPDEERGGFGGTGLLIQTEAFKRLNVGYVLDEGCPSGDSSTLFLKVDERKPFQIRLTAQGERAHGSALAAHNATHDLVEFLRIIVAQHNEQKRLLSETEPGLLLSMHVTSFQSGSFKDGAVALNVVSEEATATIDIRIPPALTIEAVRSKLLLELEQFPSLSLVVEATVDERTPRVQHETELYKALARAVSSQGIQPQAHVTEGASDLRFHLAQGIDGIGFSPFTNKSNLHGINEAISISDMVRGVHIFKQLLQDIAIIKDY